MADLNSVAGLWAGFNVCASGTLARHRASIRVAEGKRRCLLLILLLMEGCFGGSGGWTWGTYGVVGGLWRRLIAG